VAAGVEAENRKATAVTSTDRNRDTAHQIMELAWLMIVPLFLSGWHEPSKQPMIGKAGEELSSETGRILPSMQGLARRQLI
jgi:hypothetical protein